jgi:SNF2 family DNA or RNA helicase
MKSNPKQEKINPFLLAVPHWERAFKAWTDLNVIDYRGNTLSRNLLVETEFYFKDIQSKPIPDRYKFDVLITTYEMVCLFNHSYNIIKAAFDRHLQALLISKTFRGNVLCLMKLTD